MTRAYGEIRVQLGGVCVRGWWCLQRGKSSTGKSRGSEVKRLYPSTSQFCQRPDIPGGYAPRVIGTDEADANASVMLTLYIVQNRVNQLLVIARGALSYVLTKQHFKGTLLHAPNK